MSVSELREVLAKYARGDLDEAALTAAVRAQVGAADASSSRSALLAARDDGSLPGPLCLRLLALFSERRHDDDRTRLMGAPARGAAPADDDRTRVIGTPGASATGAGDDREASATDVGETTGLDDEEATAVAASRDVDDDPTAVAASRDADDDPTAVTPRPAVLPDDDRTAVITPGAPTDGSGTSTSGTSPGTFTESDLPREPAGGELGAGDEIKGRFRLLEKLGQGGMGSIWKAVDKRREEARDRNPYIAIKLLAGDFRNHPEAFIALQRECAKQQRLAHPNIATVYDFDRDGETVFMTMSLLEGQPLDAYIRHLPAGGLPVEEAMPIIEQLSSALAYAHENGLVHSDLKPGNAFLIDDGTVRLLDFGIARASRTREDAGGDTTVFDPGQLGALTPTYATVEMFDGQDPDPRDDIYALGIIAYQLLTGQHPYGKKSAPKAMQLGLEPEPVPKLDKRQNRGLRRSLAFLRDDRTPSVAEFLDDIRAKKSRTVPIAIGAVAVTLVIAALAYKPITDYVRERENEEIVAVFMRGDEASIRQGLDLVEALPDAEQRKQIAEDPRTRDAIIDLYVRRRAEVFDPAAGRYDFAAGDRQMAALAELYPDSAEVLKTRTEYYAMRDRLLADLGERLNTALEEGRLLEDPDAEDVTDVLDIVRQVAPDSPLLASAAIGQTFVARSTALREAGEWEQAEQVLETGERLAPGDAGVTGALAEVREELQRRRDAARVAELTEHWSARVPGLGDEAALETARAELEELQRLAPEQALFGTLETVVDPLLGGRVDALLGSGDEAGARSLYGRYAPFASVAAVDALRARLPAGEAATTAVEEAAAALDGALSARVGDGGRWSATLAVALKRLVASGAAGEERVTAARTRVAERLRELASEATAAEQFEAAARWLALGERLVPGDAGWGGGREALAAAEAAVRERQAAAARAERLAAMRERVLALAGEGQAREAREALATYAAEADAGDAFAAGEGVEAVAGSYLRRSGAAGGAEEALVLAREGLAVAPEHAGLREAERSLAARVLERALALAVESTVDEAAAPASGAVTRPAPPALAADTPSPVADARAGSPAYPALAPRLAGEVRDTLVARSTALREAGEWEQAEQVLETGERLAPGDAGVAGALAEVREELQRRRDAARVAELTERWSARVPGLGDEAALESARAELEELQRLAPEQALFGTLETVVDPLLGGRVDALLGSGDEAGARALYGRYAPFASVAAVDALRARLPAGEVDAAAVDEAVAALDGALSARVGDGERWSATLAVALKRLVAAGAAGEERVTAARTRVAERLRELASEATATEQFEAAARWLALGERLVPGDAGWSAGREALAAAEAAVRERQAAAARAERLAAMRERVLALAGEGQAREAREALAAYAAEADAGDAFAAGEGVEAVAGSYLRRSGAAGGAEEALVLAREGLAVAPEHAGLREAERSLAARVLERALALAVESTVDEAAAAPASVAVTRPAPPALAADTPSPVADARAGSPAYPALGESGARAARDVLAERAAATADPAALRVALDDAGRLWPGAGEALRERVGSEFVQVIADSASASNDGLRRLRGVVGDFRELFPGQWPALGEALGTRLGRDIERQQADDLERAHALLANARELLPGSAPLDLVKLKPLPRASRYAPVAMSQIEAGELTVAQATYAKMLAEEPEHEKLPEVRTALEQRLGQARAYYDAYQRYVKARRKREGQPYLQNALTLWSDNAQWADEYTAQYETEAERPGSCTERLAGYGQRSRGTCYDETADGFRGPVLVVVPAGGPAAKAFAIGKFEVSVAEFNDYCQRSGACKPVAASDPSLPVTGIRASDAAAYAKWLSATTGAVYRLPTDAEWGYAADAGGKQPRKDFNCRVTSGGAVIKGHGLVDVQSGDQNGWGLANYVGNAQEWVTSGGALAARGGAFEDPLARCEPDFKRDHDGGADALTGFRLLRELS